ncbi:DUF1129 domain-containing protein [Vagococcus salmoninarum]|uniref:DUF1129 domain-containing protein n=1 Tax=Vagococcus salmoninarum TaxID=2739 RepID=UPI00187F665B|nr:DUF1129 family protein [Vagococcus salmoninarum]MBE9389897.1 DUF1129 domain-containing protein [Vagococcus salmoninarum]
MEELALREMVAQNRELEAQLTKRNEQYIFDLKKSLVAGNLSDELQAIALSSILAELVAGQKTGKTARQLFGTVTERTDIILNAPTPAKESNWKQMWLANTLMIFGFLSLLSGALPLLSKANATGQQQGILTIIIASITGGYAFYVAYKKIYIYDRPGVDQSQRPGTLKSMGMMVGIMLVWMVFFMGSALITPTINVTLEPFVYLVLAGIGFATQYVLKKKFNIRGSLASR